MKKSFLLFSLLMAGFASFAQNKTLGVGTATPNPNAALHVESPTNNQGFIMPRLTTTQRLAMTLTPSDMGLMVYDITNTSVFAWDGTAWNEVGDIAYPVVDTVLSAPNNSNLLRIVYGGSAVESVGIAQFSNLNPNNNFNALFVTSAGTNGAGYFQVSNTASVSPALRSLTNTNQVNAPAFLGRTTGTGASAGVFEIANATNTNPSLFATTTGTGNAGRFAVNNAANSNPALYATTNGAGGVNATAILGETATGFSAIIGRATGGAANGVSGISTDPGAGSYAILGSVSATGGGQAGVFTISNPANANNTLEATTSGTGGGALIKVMNAASTKPALWAETNSNQPLSAPIFGLNTGTGDVAASFRINNSANNFSALFSESNGTNGRAATFRKLGTGNGYGVYVETFGGTGTQVDNKGTGNGYAGVFQNWETSNTFAALYAEAAGNGPSMWALKSTDAVSGDAFLAENWIPTGSAGKFVMTDATNPNPAIVTTTNSTTNGSAISASHTGTGDAIFATANSGSGGNFQNTNGSNNASIVFAMTNAQNGHAIGAMNSAEGSAFSIFQGGMKISTFEVVTGTTIGTRAAAYRVTGGGPSYTLSFPTDTGDMYMVYNDTAGAITFAGVSIPAGTGKVVINFNSGSFRGL